MQLIAATRHSVYLQFDDNSFILERGLKRSINN